MEIDLCALARGHRLWVEVATGLLGGAIASFAALTLFCRMSRLSEVPTRMLPEYLGAALLGTLLRLLMLAIPMGVGLAILGQWVAVAISPVEYLDCPQHVVPSRFLLLGLPLAILVLIELRLMVFFLDRRFAGSNAEVLARLVREANGDGSVFPRIEESLLRKARFLTSRAPEARYPVSYGGLVSRPRIVFPEGMVELLGPGLVIPILLAELARVRRGDAVFDTIGLSFRLWLEALARRLAPAKGLAALARLLEEGHRRLIDRFVITDTLGRYQPERTVIAFAARGETLAPAITESGHETYTELRERALDAIEREARAKNPAMLWIAQLYRGGTSRLRDPELMALLRQRQRLRWVVAAVLGLALVGGVAVKAKEALAYHRKFNKMAAGGKRAATEAGH